MIASTGGMPRGGWEKRWCCAACCTVGGRPGWMSVPLASPGGMTPRGGSRPMCGGSLRSLEAGLCVLMGTMGRGSFRSRYS